MISSSVKKEKQTEINVSTELIELTPSNNTNPFLQIEVTSLDAPEIMKDNLKIQIIGAEFGDRDSKNILGLNGINGVKFFEVGYVAGRTAAKNEA